MIKGEEGEGEMGRQVGKFTGRRTRRRSMVVQGVGEWKKGGNGSDER